MGGQFSYNVLTLQIFSWGALCNVPVDTRSEFHKQSEQAGREQVNKSPDIRNVKEKAEYQSFKPPNIRIRNPASLKL